MRIALCLSGLSYGHSDKHINKNKNKKGDIVDYKVGYKYYKKNIIKINENIDIFIHTWDSTVG